MSSEKRTFRIPVEKAVSPQDIATRRKAFIWAGFSKEWVDKLSLTKPTLYSAQVLMEHLHGLEDRGFANPHKMAESFPPILGYTLDISMIN